MKSQATLKTLSLFGSTGSIGQQTLEVLRAFPGEFEVVGLTALKNDELLAEQAAEFLPKSLPGQTFLSPTSDQIATLIATSDFVINAVPGFDGLAVSLAAVRAGKILLSANKESFAIAGRFLREEAQKTGAEIRPLDSEASAIWQLLTEGELNKKKNALSSVTLTCSGGPFFGRKTADLQDVTIEEALAHPTWKMGQKVSIDSATLVNKVLEVYEVHHLFDIPLDKIDITIHRQSLAHSLIRLRSGATRLHVTQNDMRLFISYALHFPNQPKCPWPIQRVGNSQLKFEDPDADTFLPLKWLKMHAGNPNFPIILNAMNDLAVERFLGDKLTFLGIYDLIEAGLERFLWVKPPRNLEELLAFHEEIQGAF
jgi:1-deoxy-D-xylulose-5-phosphate reductoisomerase